MEMSYKLYTREKKPPISIKWEAEWTAQMVSTFRSREKSVAPARIGISFLSVHNLGFSTVYDKF
jgi:hypothetical protein